MLTVHATHPTLRASSLLAFLLTGFAVASLFPSLLVAMIFSLLLAFILRPLVRFFEIHLGIRRTISVAMVFLALIIFLLISAANGIPDLMNYARGLYTGFQNFPLDRKLDELVHDVTKGLPFINPQSASARIRSMIDESIQAVGHGAASAAGSAFSFLIVPFVTYFALAEGDRAAKRLLERVPNKYFEMTLNVVDKIQKDLVGYLRGWLLDSLVVGVLNVIGFYVIGVQYALLLGVISGISNLIPYVGPFVGVIPVFLISVTQTGDLSLIPPIAMMTLVVQLVDNIVVQPLCFAKTVDMHPLTVIVVLIVGNQLMGVLGMLLAIPLYTILKVTAVETHWGLREYRITA
ncbi:MAG: AI-2E family transporter [Ignavibacteriales bacterium]|nr:AI-2E family transporter [Ignavibacteriales bacterium]